MIWTRDMKQEEQFEIRDIRKKDQYVMDDAYYNGYAKICGPWASLVYLALCRHADIYRQTCFPSISRIAENLRISGRQVIRGLRILEDHNVIRRERTLGKSNKYWLIDKKHWKRTGAPQSPVTNSHRCQPVTSDSQSHTSDHQSPEPVTDSHTKDSHIRIHNKDLKYIPSPEPENIPYEEIISHMNARTGASYRHERPKTRQLIKARWKEGFRLGEFVKVIDNMAASWSGNLEMQNYLRPETLFSNKFESYLNWKTGGSNENNRTTSHNGSAAASAQDGKPGKYAGIGELLAYE
jgi:uncharacterized phage protein (TIGR02220 family)